MLVAEIEASTGLINVAVSTAGIILAKSRHLGVFPIMPIGNSVRGGMLMDIDFLSPFFVLFCFVLFFCLNRTNDSFIFNSHPMLVELMFHFYPRLKSILDKDHRFYCVLHVFWNISNFKAI